MRKRILTLILTMVIVLGSVPAFSTSAAEKQGYQKRTTSELGVNFIEAFEGYYQYAYWDYSQYTIGYGTRCEKDEYPAGISEPAAHALLKKVLPDYESPLNSFLKKNDIYLTQNQFDALVSFTYNMGGGVWSRDTTIAKYLKNGIDKYTDKQIADALGLWVNAGGVKLQGLVDRRAAESKLFCTDDFSFDKEVYVVTDAVNLRSGPGTSYSYINSLSRGSIVTVTEKRYLGKRAWGKTVYNAKTCWFSLDYAKYANDESTSSELLPTCLYKVENVESGISLHWKKVKGADGYKIYKKEEGSSAYLLTKTITNKATVSYTDTAVSEKQYKYYIIAYKGSTNATRSSVCQIEFVSAPTLKSVSKLANGFKIKWSKDSSASGYFVMRRSDDDSTYIKLVDVDSSVTSYSDTTAVGGVKYYYTVKSYNSRGVSGAPTAKSSIYLAAPTITSASNTSKAITISWTKSYKADGYYVYRKVASGSNKLIATLKGNDKTSYTDSAVSKNTNYNYYVKAYATGLKSKLSGSFPTKIYTPPTISSAKSTTSGIALSWKAVSDAKQYNVYRRLSSDKNYAKIATVRGTSYKDTTASAGAKYYYKLTSVTSNLSESYKSGAKSCSNFVATKIKASAVVKTGLKISWKKVSNAKSYSVYKYASKKYVLLGTVTGKTFTDKTIGKANSRTYAVKVNYASGQSGYSAKFKAYNLATPKLKVKSTANGLLLSWDTVKKATGIIIYRKGPGDSKFKLYSTQKNYGKNTFENSTAKKGKKYSYKIKVIRGNCKSLVSNTVTCTRK